MRVVTTNKIPMNHISNLFDKIPGKKIMKTRRGKFKKREIKPNSMGIFNFDEFCNEFHVESAFMFLS
jgi:hypothetical protein